VAGFAYVVMAHASPDDVLGHVRRIHDLSPSAPVLLRSFLDSPVAAADVDGAARATGATPWHSSIEVRWGDWSLTSAALESLSRARAEWDPDFTVLVSGADHPVRDLHRWEAETAAAGAEALLRPDDRDYSYRWRRCWHTLPGGTRSSPVYSAAASATRRLDLPVRVQDAGDRTWMWHHGRHGEPPLPYRKGSFWCVLSRSAVEVLLAAAGPGTIADFFRSTLLPDESFTHSVLAASGLRVSPGATSFTIFPPEDLSHPRPLVADDLDAALASGAPFARKVVPEADGRSSAFAAAADAVVDAERRVACGQGQITS
jgi:hypothetical protein